MSTVINHGQMAQIDENGNINVFYPKTFSDDVYVDNNGTTLTAAISSINTSLASSVNTIQSLESGNRIHTIYKGASGRLCTINDDSVTDQYYPTVEVNTLLNGKASSSHTHDDRYYTETEMNTWGIPQMRFIASWTLGYRISYIQSNGMPSSYSVTLTTNSNGYVQYKQPDSLPIINVSGSANSVGVVFSFVDGHHTVRIRPFIQFA